MRDTTTSSTFSSERNTTATSSWRTDGWVWGFSALNNCIPSHHPPSSIPAIIMFTLHAVNVLSTQSTIACQTLCDSYFIFHNIKGLNPSHQEYNECCGLKFPHHSNRIVRPVKPGNTGIWSRPPPRLPSCQFIFIKSTQETISQTTISLCNFWHETK